MTRHDHHKNIRLANYRWYTLWISRINMKTTIHIAWKRPKRRIPRLSTKPGIHTQSAESLRTGPTPEASHRTEYRTLWPLAIGPIH
ncbi:hypothetical protein M758_UG144300 [Ceratodon purpureus]|nr:hypothetical protein M758_UG144300 [Ceratodon purpureus]